MRKKQLRVENERLRAEMAEIEGALAYWYGLAPAIVNLPKWGAGQTRGVTLRLVMDRDGSPPPWEKKGRRGGDGPAEMGIPNLPPEPDPADPGPTEPPADDVEDVDLDVICMTRKDWGALHEIHTYLNVHLGMILDRGLTNEAHRVRELRDELERILDDAYLPVSES